LPPPPPEEISPQPTPGNGNSPLLGTPSSGPKPPPPPPPLPLAAGSIRPPGFPPPIPQFKVRSLLQAFETVQSGPCEWFFVFQMKDKLSAPFLKAACRHLESPYDMILRCFSYFNCFSLLLLTFFRSSKPSLQHLLSISISSISFLPPSIPRLHRCLCLVRK
jgi:hypothetical protein